MSVAFYHTHLVFMYCHGVVVFVSMCLCFCRCVCVLSRCRCVCVCVCVDVFVFVSMCLCIVTVSMSKWVSVSLESPRLQPATRYSWQKTSAHCSAMSNVQLVVLLTAHYTFHSVHVSLHPVNCRMVHIHIHIHISISTLISFPVIHNMYTLSLDCSGDIFWSPFLHWDNSSIFVESVPRLMNDRSCTGCFF